MEEEGFLLLPDTLQAKTQQTIRDFIRLLKEKGMSARSMADGSGLEIFDPEDPKTVITHKPFTDFL